MTTINKTDKLREAFEDAMEKEYKVRPVFDTNKHYGSFQAYWYGWQAALTHERAHSDVLAGALFGLRYSHGCWCDSRVESSEIHSRCCAAANRAFIAHEARKV